MFMGFKCTTWKRLFCKSKPSNFIHTIFLQNIFYCNVNSERSVNHITSESLQIELIAGGLSPDQERYIMSKMNPDEYGEVRMGIAVKNNFGYSFLSFKEAETPEI